MENLAYIFGEMNLVLQLILELQILKKTVMSSSLRKRKEVINSADNFVLRKFF